MPSTQRFYLDCQYIDGGFCTAIRIEIEPDTGCITYEPIGSFSSDDWDKEKEDTWDDIGFEEMDEDYLLHDGVDGDEES